MQAHRSLVVRTHNSSSLTEQMLTDQAAPTYIYISHIYIYIYTCVCFKSQTASNIPLSMSLSASHQRPIYLIKCQQVQTKASFTDLQTLKTTKQICSISIHKTSNFIPVGKSILRKCEANQFMFL